MPESFLNKTDIPRAEVVDLVDLVNKARRHDPLEITDPSVTHVVIDCGSYREASNLADPIGSIIRYVKKNPDKTFTLLNITELADRNLGLSRAYEAFALMDYHIVCHLLEEDFL